MNGSHRTLVLLFLPGPAGQCAGAPREPQLLGLGFLNFDIDNVMNLEDISFKQVVFIFKWGQMSTNIF